MNSAIILMAGKGTRTGLTENKTLVKINNKPVFMYSLEKFLDLGLEVVLVINKKEENIVKKYITNLDVKIAYGGTTRGGSSYNGLLKCSGEYVLIHDAARPFIPVEAIKMTLNYFPSPVVVCSKVINTIKEITPRGLKTLERSRLLSAETPQAALRKDFLDAYKKAFEDEYLSTDDISLIERYITNDIRIVITNGNNKITTSEDLTIAKVRLGEYNV